MKLTGGEIICKQLVAQGVPYIAGIPGHGCLALFDAIRREEAAGNLKYIQVKHEHTSAAIADGYYRVAGKPMAVFASIGPGTLNLSIGIGNAYVDSTAFLALCGDTHVHMIGTGVLQEIERYQDSNIIRSLEPLAKRTWRAESTRQLPRMMSRAFRQMTQGRPGPCVIALPMDVQAEAIDCDVAPVQPPALPIADSTSIANAAALMQSAKRPVILAGGGALHAKAGELITQLAEAWGAAVITTLAGKGTVAETHDQYGFHTGSKGTAIGVELSRKADVVLAVGTRFADETTCSYRKGAAFNFPETKLVHIDLDAGELGKNYTPDVAINADLCDSLRQLLGHKFAPNADYLAEIKQLRADWFAYLAGVRAQQTNKLTISQLTGILNEALPSDTIISTSSGNTQAQLFQEYCYAEAGCNLTTGGFSTMGWAVPAAMGAKLAAPQRPVIAYLGDGDFMMNMQELSTMAQYDIPVVVVLADNQGWMAIKDLQIGALGAETAFGNDFAPTTDFYAIAKGFGVAAWRANTADDVKTALNEAIASNKPALLHIDVCREHPHSGGRAFGWWDVPVPAYLEERRAVYEQAIAEEVV